MPAIFDDDKREGIRIRLLENGFDQIKRYGMKKTSVEEVAKASGIAKGTFYNFFPSKEEFVASIISYKREKFKGDITTLIHQEGCLSKSSVRKILMKMAFGDENLYTYLTAEDLAVLATRAPGSIIPMEENVALTTGALLKMIPDKRDDCDWKVIANYMKILALSMLNKEMLLEDALDRNLEGIISLTMNAIFGEETK